MVPSRRELPPSGYPSIVGCGPAQFSALWTAATLNGFGRLRSATSLILTPFLRQGSMTGLVDGIPHRTRELLVVRRLVHPNRGPTQATQLGLRRSLIMASDNHDRQLWGMTAQEAYDAVAGKVSEEAEMNDSNSKMLDRQYLRLGLRVRNQGAEALGQEQILDLEGEQRFIVHDEG